MLPTLEGGDPGGVEIDDVPQRDRDRTLFPVDFLNELLDSSVEIFPCEPLELVERLLVFTGWWREKRGVPRFFKLGPVLK